VSESLPFPAAFPAQHRFLICAKIARGRGWQIFTADADFRSYVKVLGEYNSFPTRLTPTPRAA